MLSYFHFYSPVCLMDHKISKSQLLLSSLFNSVEDFYKKWVLGAENTQKAYKTDLKQFFVFCQGLNLNPLPASEKTIMTYIAYMAEHKKYKVATIYRKLACIVKVHAVKGFSSPVTHKVQQMLKGVKEKKWIAQKTAPAFDENTLKNILQNFDDDKPIHLRNKALFLLHFAGAFRVSELLALNIEDLEFKTDFLIITITKSKTNQQGKIQQVAIPYGSNPQTCPIRTTQKRLESLQKKSWPLFVAVNKGGAISSSRLNRKNYNNRVVKKYVGKNYSSHSFRHSFITCAIHNGATINEIMVQTHHKSVQTVLRYFQQRDLTRQNAVTKLHL